MVRCALMKNVVENILSIVERLIDSKMSQSNMSVFADALMYGNQNL